MDKILSGRSYATAKSYYGSKDTTKYQFVRTKLTATFYEFQSRFRAMKASRLTAMGGIFNNTLIRMQRVNAGFSALVATQPAASVSSHVSSEVLRRAVYRNHRLLRAKAPVSRIPAGTQSAFLTKAAYFCAASGKFVRNHWVKIAAASLLFGSVRYAYKHGQSQLHVDKADLTVLDRLRKTKDNLIMRASDEYNWRWSDFWCNGPIMEVWGYWWFRIF